MHMPKRCVVPGGDSIAQRAFPEYRAVAPVPAYVPLGYQGVRRERFGDAELRQDAGGVGSQLNPGTHRRQVTRLFQHGHPVARQPERQGCRSSPDPSSHHDDLKAAVHGRSIAY
jgi:hypothetical protein